MIDRIIVETSQDSLYKVSVRIDTMYYIDHVREIKEWLSSRGIEHIAVLDVIYFPREDDAHAFVLTWSSRQ